MENKFQREVMAIQKLEAAYALIHMRTKHPYVTCDEETFNDQIWLYDTEETAKAQVEKIKENKTILAIGKVESKQMLNFLSGLYTIGVNEVVFHEKEASTKIPLDKIVTPPDYSKLPENQRPVSNPQMQLTGIYFIQELSRQVPMEEKHTLKELEEEMAVNLVRSRFLVALEVDGEAPAQDGSNVKFPCVKTKDGHMFQPIFTDVQELRKFNTENKYRATLLSFEGITKMIGNNVNGVVVNPQSVNIVVPRENLASLKERFL